MSNGIGIAAANPDKGDAPQKERPKMQNFEPIAGSIVIFGYDQLGSTEGVSLEVRELFDDRGGRARGVLANVKQDEYRSNHAFIDQDEIPELLKGIDALLQIKTNPTKFSNFEVRYKTKGDFQITAYNTMRGSLFYAVQAGSTAQSLNLRIEHMEALKRMLSVALNKLASLDV